MNKKRHGIIALLILVLLFSLLITGCKVPTDKEPDKEPPVSDDAEGDPEEDGSDVLPDTDPVSPPEESAPSLAISRVDYSITTELIIKYYVSCENVESTEPLKLLVWRNPPKNAYYQGGTQTAVLTSFTEETVNGKNYCVFEYSGYKYTDIATPIYTRAILDGEGVLSGVNKYSLLSYAYDKLGLIDSSTKSDDELMIENLEETVKFSASIQRYLETDLQRPLDGNWYSVKTEGGIISDGFTEGLYFPGDKVVLRANAVENKEFSHWECDGVNVGSTERIEITVTESHKLYKAIYK